jgi:hypothetical protein
MAFGRIIVVCVPPIPCRVTTIGAFLSFVTFDDTNSAYGVLILDEPDSGLDVTATLVHPNL